MHTNQETSFVIVAPRLIIAIAQRRVWYGDIELQLTPTEWKALCLLAHAPDSVHEHTQLMHALWGDDPTTRQSPLHNVMHHLRRKLTAVGTGTAPIENVPRVGYRLGIADIIFA